MNRNGIFGEATLTDRIDSFYDRFTILHEGRPAPRAGSFTFTVVCDVPNRAARTFTFAKLSKVEVIKQLKAQYGLGLAEAHGVVTRIQESEAKVDLYIGNGSSFQIQYVVD